MQPMPMPRYPQKSNNYMSKLMTNVGIGKSIRQEMI